MSKKQTENKIPLASVNTDLLNNFVDTLTNRELLHGFYFRTFGYHNVPLNGSDDVLRACIQELKDYYKLD